MSIAVSAQTITTFDAPGAGTGAFQGTFGGGLTPNGTIMGNYFDADNLSHGFLRDRNGAFTTFNAPGTGNVPGPFQGTYPFAINTKGAITGWYVDATNVNHGFVRDKHGAIVEFDLPGAGTGAGQVCSIAPNGAVTGFFFDPNNVVHGLRARSGWGRVELTQIYRTVTPGRPMPLRKRHSLPEIIAHERLRPALTPVEV